jgi:DNA topoisomerase IB
MKTDSSTAAKLAGLNISDRNILGLKRAKKYIESSDSEDSKEFFWEYFLPDGKKLTDEDRISELNALAVPPAWENVWFCTDEKGHIQATGKDYSIDIIQNGLPLNQI